MQVKDVCRLVKCERFHVYLAIRKRIIAPEKDSVGRYSFSNEDVDSIKLFYSKIKRRFKNRVTLTRRAYLYGSKK